MENPIKEGEEEGKKTKEEESGNEPEKPTKAPEEKQTNKYFFRYTKITSAETWLLIFGVIVAIVGIVVIEVVARTSGNSYTLAVGGIMIGVGAFMAFMSVVPYFFRKAQWIQALSSYSDTKAHCDRVYHALGGCNTREEWIRKGYKDVPEWTEGPEPKTHPVEIDEVLNHTEYPDGT